MNVNFPQVKRYFTFLCLGGFLMACGQKSTIEPASSKENMANHEITKIKVATFNVSMEALNYAEKGATISGNELSTALTQQHQQIKNIAEIIQRVAPDILLLNEFDYIKEPSQGIEYFQQHYLSISQNGHQPIAFPYYYYATVNTGEPMTITNMDSSSPTPLYGFGHFPGHFAMVLLSKYPLDTNNIRTFQHFKWRDMPNALIPKNPETNKPWYSDEVWQQFRLSSKSHWDIPVIINNKSIHLLISHPTPPVFDGPENRNGYRNHDEIRFWRDYIEPTESAYIYDDNATFGGLADNTPFIILGDLNASPDEGDAINESIAQLVKHQKINQSNAPISQGGKQHSPDNQFAASHTAAWRMRADYVLPSKVGFTMSNAGVFWPTQEEDGFHLIADRKSSSDHRLVWLELELTQ